MRHVSRREHLEDPRMTSPTSVLSAHGQAAALQDERSRRLRGPFRQAPIQDRGRSRRVTKGGDAEAGSQASGTLLTCHPHQAGRSHSHRRGYRLLPEHLNPSQRGRRAAGRQCPSSWRGRGAPLNARLRDAAAGAMPNPCPNVWKLIFAKSDSCCTARGRNARRQATSRQLQPLPARSR
jgi:hypothetical protein